MATTSGYVYKLIFTTIRTGKGKIEWFKFPGMHEKNNIDVCCLILASMNSELQKQYENMDSAFDMINNLKAMFQEQARTERYNIVKAIFDCKMGDKDPVSPHVMKLISYFDNLERLDAGISQQLATDIILQSLPPVYKDFVLNYNLHDLQRSL
ncbi:uncharacterized protein LOC141649646 [Silene latifolia]|uniref:uncharacterized protein LOC141649646 n=1 Tax=Silene latifolia TaxID=37657 RepID=UPI003D773799